jgi:hypothetical protein
MVRFMGEGMPIASLGRPTQAIGPTPRPDHPRFHRGAGGAVVGLPQLAGRPLLPVIRVDRREGRLRALHGRRGAEGAGVGGRADLGALNRPHSGPRARPVRPLGKPLARHPHVQCLRVLRPAAATRGRAGFQVGKSGGNTESRDSNTYCCTSRPRRPSRGRTTAAWSEYRRKIALERVRRAGSQAMISIPRQRAARHPAER